MQQQVFMHPPYAEAKAMKVKQHLPLQHSAGQHNNAFQQTKYAFYGNPDNSEWQRKYPHNGIQHQRQDSERPAEHEKDDPG